MRISTPEPIELPPRAEDVSYVRPPMEDQNLVPDHYDKAHKQ